MKKRTLIAGLLLAAGFALAGCGSSSDAPPPADPPPPPPPPPAAVDFSQFVRDRFAATADDTDPVAIDETEFSFADMDNPDAFDDLLGGNP
jgi:hypothetical protein